MKINKLSLLMTLWSVLLFSMTLSGQVIGLKSSQQELFLGDRYKVVVNWSYPVKAILDSTSYRVAPTNFEKVKDSLVSKVEKGGFVTEVREQEFLAFADSSLKYFKYQTLNYQFEGALFTVLSDSLPLTVKSLMGDSRPAYADSLLKKLSADTTSQILPLKELASVPLTSKEKWMLLIAVVTIILLTLFILYLYRRPKKEVKKEVPPSPKEAADIIAVRELQALKEAKLAEKGEIKEFTVRLSMILRNYLENRYLFNAVELTSDEIKSIISQYIANRETALLVSNFLNQTDLVKFAKFQPDIKELYRYYDLAMTIVEKTKNDNQP